MNLRFILPFLCTLFFTSFAFADGYYSSNYGPRIVESYPGVIVDKRWVQYDSYVGNNEKLGTVAGAVTGGAVGAAFGGGTGKIATVIGGSVLGGFLGNSIGKNTPEYETSYMFEYTMRRDDGSLMTILQSPNFNYPLGQRVLLERSTDGRWFFVPQR